MRLGLVRSGKVGLGMERFYKRWGSVRRGVVWLGVVRSGTERFCFTKVTLLLFRKGEGYGRFRRLFS